MDRPRIIRGLRIAWTAVFGVLCLLLIVLWVRSYWNYDIVVGPIANAGNVGVSSVKGGLIAQVILQAPNPTKWEYRSLAKANNQEWPVQDFHFHFLLLYAQTAVRIDVPLWFMIVILSCLAAVPWVKLRFGMRTLLIATTLIAVVLGLVVWSLRS